MEKSNFLTFMEISKQLGISKYRIEHRCDNRNIDIHMVKPGYGNNKPVRAIRFKDLDKLANPEEKIQIDGISLMDLSTELGKTKNTLAKWCEEKGIKPFKGICNARYITYAEADQLRVYVPQKPGAKFACTGKSVKDKNRDNRLYMKIMPYWSLNSHQRSV